MTMWSGLYTDDYDDIVMYTDDYGDVVRLVWVWGVMEGMAV